MSQITFCQFDFLAPNGVPNLAVSLMVKKMRQVSNYDGVCAFKNAHEMHEALLKYLEEVCMNNASEKKRISIKVNDIFSVNFKSFLYDRKYINLIYNDDDDTKKVTLMAQILVGEKGGES